MTRRAIWIFALGLVACAGGPDPEGLTPSAPGSFSATRVEELPPSCELEARGVRLAPTFAPELAVLVSTEGEALCVDTWAALALSHPTALEASAPREPESDLPAEVAREEMAGCDDFDTSGVDQGDPSPRP